MIVEEGGKWLLKTKDGSRVLGTHATKAEAEAQERAVEASKHSDSRSVKRFDRGELQKPVRLDNGFLRVDAYLTRTGVFEYLNADGSSRREYRPPAEVFHADALASLERAPVTNDHPKEGHVNSKNRRSVSVGTTSGVRQDGSKVAGSLQVEDADAVADVDAGKQEVSCGYSADLDEIPGISPEGERYDCVQKNIRYNHVALVSRGRAGPEVRIRMDNLDAELIQSFNIAAIQELKIVEIEIEIAGVKVKVPETTAALITKAHTDATAALDATKAKLDAAVEALTVAKAAHADAVDPAKFTAAVAARVALEAKAHEIVGAETVLTGTDRDVRVAVITKLAPGFTAEGRSDEYVQARYDAALEHASAATVDAVRKTITHIPASGVHTDSADTAALVAKAEAEFNKRNAEAYKITVAP